MAGVNKVILIGNLGGDPTSNTLQSGMKVANFSLATSDSYTDKQTGEKKEITIWHNIELWDKQAELACNYLKKGSKVYIEGKLVANDYTDKSGSLVKGYKIRANAMNFIDSGQKDNNIARQSSDPQQAPISASVKPVYQGSNDLPF